MAEIIPDKSHMTISQSWVDILFIMCPNMAPGANDDVSESQEACTLHTARQTRPWLLLLLSLFVLMMMMMLGVDTLLSISWIMIWPYNERIDLY